MVQSQEEITLHSDSVASDSAAIDVVSQEGKALNYGIQLREPKTEGIKYIKPQTDAMSWILTVLILVFVVACIRYSKNTRYFAKMFNDMMERRERSSNMDGTVRESSFLFLLNILWCLSVGILVYGLVAKKALGHPVEIWTSTELAGILICGAVAVGYTLFLIVAYGVVANVFSDASKSATWVSGYLSTQALEAIFMFPLAIIGLALPSALIGLLIVGSIGFMISKIIFIYKSFCIFFRDSSSWVLFLYYLCSLEIVPIIFAYKAAVNLSV